MTWRTKQFLSDTLFVVAAIAAFLAFSGCNTDAELSPIGGACEEVADCSTDNDTCITRLGGNPQSVPEYTDFSGGFCTATCDQDSDCAVDSRCLPYHSGDEFAYCFPRCTSNDECRTDEGYTCTQLSQWHTEALCLPNILCELRPWCEPANTVNASTPYDTTPRTFPGE